MKRVYARKRWPNKKGWRHCPCGQRFATRGRTSKWHDRLCEACLDRVSKPRPPGERRCVKCTTPFVSRGSGDKRINRLCEACLAAPRRAVMWGDADIASLRALRESNVGYARCATTMARPLSSVIYAVKRYMPELRGSRGKNGAPKKKDRSIDTCRQHAHILGGSSCACRKGQPDAPPDLAA